MVQKVNIELSPGATPEEVAAHEAEMAKVADENEGNLSIKDKDGNITEVKKDAGGAEITKRPDDIPEKFWDAEKGVVNVDALLKSQKDAETALLAAGKKPDAELTDEEKAAAEKAAAEAQPEVVANASAEFAKEGKLSDETYTKLEAQGMPKAMVDEYIAGQEAIVERIEHAAAEPFGGSFENYNTAADWAAEHMTEDEVKALDVQLTSTNPAIVKQGAAALQVKYAANADISPDTVILGDGTSTQSGTSFKSSAEMQAAMNDPRYKTDESYRQEVAAKLSRSDAKLFG